MERDTTATLIAQITDIHIGFEPSAGDQEFNYLRFCAVLDHLLEQPVQPDLLILSGDLTDGGSPDCYDRLKRAIALCPFPVYPMTGNHDRRAQLVSAFPGYEDENGFVQFAIEREGLRILCLDSLEEGRHGGGFCERRAAWLTAQLESCPDTPTIVVLHHPPVVAGIEWMDPRPHEAWFQRFHETVRGHGQIVAIQCGHLHRALTTTVEGIPLTVTPAVAPAVSLDLRPIDPEKPDGRAIVAAEPACYSLHLWRSGQLVSHLQPVGEWRELAHYGANLQGMMRGLFAERA